MTTGLYLYCIGRAYQLSDDRVATLDAPVVDGSSAQFRTVKNGDLAALVSDTEVTTFEIERDSLMAHHRVLEQAMHLGDILPISYGTVAASEREIAETLLEDSREQLSANLAYVEGCVELTLRVMWNRDVLFQEVVDEYDEIRALRDAIGGVAEDWNYYERVQLGELTSAAIEYKSELEREQILAELESISVDFVVNPSTSDMLILNASFLVERDRESEFDKAVQRTAAPRQDRMIFRYIGPLPPASFVSVQIGAGG